MWAVVVVVAAVEATTAVVCPTLGGAFVTPLLWITNTFLLFCVAWEVPRRSMLGTETCFLRALLALAWLPLDCDGPAYLGGVLVPCLEASPSASLADKVDSEARLQVRLSPGFGGAFAAISRPTLAVVRLALNSDGFMDSDSLFPL